VQKFNETAARSQSSMLTLAAIALIVPAAFHYLGGSDGRLAEAGISLDIAVVLILTYGLGLFFSLHTHKRLFIGDCGNREVEEEGPEWSMSKSIGLLALSTALIAWVSEILVGAVEPAAQAFGMTSIFVGVIIVAIVGNAAEHSTAVMAALHNRMDLCLGIAIGSSIQVALFVAPLLVFISYLLGPTPMDLVFTPAEVMAIGLAVTITGQIASDGESNWLEGVQLLAVYIILGIVFYYLPEAHR
jgi:calcium/proton exchanger (cax)